MTADVVGAPLAAVAVVGGLGVGLVVRLVRSRLRERRKARYFAQLSAQYRKQPRALPASKPTPAEELPSRKITVKELVARLEGEGLPVRLQWDDENGHGSDEDDWPTGVLPRIEVDDS